MGRSTKSAWLEGPGDLKEADVEDVPVAGESVRVRGLPAAYSNQASSEALELKTIGNQQIATVNTARLEVLQFAHGCIDPSFTVEEAQAVSERFGPAFKKVIAKIDELSGVDKAAVEEANARFQGGRNGSPDDGQAGLHEPAAGDDESALSPRVGIGASYAGGGDV
jgi:hypothetical protein